ncbi:uncharacterized protein HD556DRAFT_1394228, partial [Suillus plorans]
GRFELHYNKERIGRIATRREAPESMPIVATISLLLRQRQILFLVSTLVCVTQVAGVNVFLPPHATRKASSIEARISRSHSRFSCCGSSGRLNVLNQTRINFSSDCTIVADVLVGVTQGKDLREVRKAQNSSIFDLKMNRDSWSQGHTETTYGHCRHLSTLWLTSRMSWMPLNEHQQTYNVRLLKGTYWDS